MNKIDLHVHTVASTHAFNTIYELAAEAEKKGMEGFAVTDHGPAARGCAADYPYFMVLCKRVPAKIGRVHIFKGIEANILNLKGETDIPESLIPGFDLIMAYMHTITGYEDLGRKKNTRAVINAMEQNRHIDVLSHPVPPWYDVDAKFIAEAASGLGVALELNENTLKDSRVDLAEMDRLIEYNLLAGGRFTASSDAHVATELGVNRAIGKLIDRFKISDSQIINSSLESTQAFITERKKFKRL